MVLLAVHSYFLWANLSPPAAVWLMATLDRQGSHHVSCLQSGQTTCNNYKNRMWQLKCNPHFKELNKQSSDKVSSGMATLLNFV